MAVQALGGRNADLRAGRPAGLNPHGRVFGAADAAVVDFASHAVTAVDLTDIPDLGTERMAILGYLFRRIEMLIEDRRPTLIVIDEAWKVLDDTYFAKKLAEWLVTARKKNVVVVMMTQFPGQIRGSKARSILEALPNQRLFPNGEATAADDDSFRLTDGAMDFVLNPIPGQRRVLSRNPRGSTVLKADFKAFGPLLTVLGGGQAGLYAFGADYASRAQFWKDCSCNAIKSEHYLHCAKAGRACRSACKTAPPRITRPGDESGQREKRP